MTAAFLQELRTLLTPASAWHPLACANAEGVLLGEFEQCAVGEGRLWGDRGPRNWAPTYYVPVRWNLPCAIRFLLDQWEDERRFNPPGVRGGYYGTAKQKLRESVIAALAPQCPRHDLWNVTEHHRALVILDTAIARQAENGRAA
jgi:hypothetical protein